MIYLHNLRFAYCGLSVEELCLWQMYPGSHVKHAHCAFTKSSSLLITAGDSNKSDALLRERLTFTFILTISDWHCLWLFALTWHGLMTFILWQMWRLCMFFKLLFRHTWQQLQEPNQSRPDLQTLYNSPYQMTQGYGCYDISQNILYWRLDSNLVRELDLWHFKSETLLLPTSTLSWY